MRNSTLTLVEQHIQLSEMSNVGIQQTITIWLSNQLNTVTQTMPAPNFRRRHLK